MDSDEGTGNETNLGRWRIHSWGFATGVTRVYGEGGLPPTLPAGVKMLISGAHETLEKLTEKDATGSRIFL